MADELKNETQLSEKEKNDTALVTAIMGDVEGGDSLPTGFDSGKPTTQIAKVGHKLPPIEHRFKPGQSGNPSGKPKTKHIRDAALKIGLLDPVQLDTYKPKTVFEEMVLNAAKVIRNPDRNSAAAIQAFNALADRIDGKPKPSDEELDSNANKQVVVIGGSLIRKNQPTED
jgi:hypothetical protein